MSSRKQIETPRPYLSYSAFALFRRSPEEWRRAYLLGQGTREFRGAEFGKRFAKARETGDDGGNRDIAFARAFLPLYPKREYIMKAWNETCWVLGKFDGYDPYRRLIADDKTTKSLGGRPAVWTQQMVDRLEQLTFYCYVYLKKFGVMPRLELNWYSFDTKVTRTFRTSRTKVDMLTIHGEINETWAGILRMCWEASHKTQ